MGNHESINDCTHKTARSPITKREQLLMVFTIVSDNRGKLTYTVTPTAADCLSLLKRFDSYQHELCYLKSISLKASISTMPLDFAVLLRCAKSLCKTTELIEANVPIKSGYTRCDCLCYETVTDKLDDIRTLATVLTHSKPISVPSLALKREDAYMEECPMMLIAHELIQLPKDIELSDVTKQKLINVYLETRARFQTQKRQPIESEPDTATTKDEKPVQYFDSAAPSITKTLVNLPTRSSNKDCAVAKCPRSLVNTVKLHILQQLARGFPLMHENVFAIELASVDDCKVPEKQRSSSLPQSSTSTTLVGVTTSSGNNDARSSSFSVMPNHPPSLPETGSIACLLEFEVLLCDWMDIVNLFPIPLQ